MLWSQRSVPGRPRLLMVDGSRNAGGWEGEFCDRIFQVLRRKGLEIVGEAPIRTQAPENLGETLLVSDGFNCLFLMCHGANERIPAGSRLRAYWAWLSQRQGLPPRLMAVCTWDDHDAEASRSILAGDGFAQLAVAPLSPLSPRAAGLFFMKFFTELDAHTQDSITGKMVWFSHSKAKELLKRRRLPGQVGVRC